MTFQEMERMLTGIKNAYPKYAPKEINQDLVALWTLKFKEESVEQFRKAFVRAMDTIDEWPQIATIKRFCLGFELSDKEIGQKTADLIDKAIRKWGYNNLEQARQEIGAFGWEVVLHFGGWVAVCNVTEEEMPFTRNKWKDQAILMSKEGYKSGKNAIAIQTVKPGLHIVGKNEKHESAPISLTLKSFISNLSKQNVKR
jgi:Loader and inhibitor of phage G40P